MHVGGQHRARVAIAIASLLGCASLEEGGQSGEEGSSGGTTSSATLGPSSSGSATGSGSGSASGSITASSGDTTSSTSNSVTTDIGTEATTATGESTTQGLDESSGGSSQGTSGSGSTGTSSSSTEAEPSERRVFLSSESFDGDLGGALGADASCQSLADDASLGGAWLAYIIDDDNDLSRHVQDDRPFYKLDEVLVADDWADLNDGDILSSIDVTENETTPGGNAWTGFYDVGGAPDNFCTNWTFNGGDCLANGVCGSAGESNMTDTHWDGYYVFDCSSSFRLYCIEQ